ncbi:hypothetical protein C7399_103249 [Paraburkholderia tropica]|uniref:Uncharacterized protein n=1 Tax=Paraburkholderia tropica TaxID=92647 RepID=A0ABX5MXL8_9BURK|nr:hypothetical protein C7400_103249 [Paraburkholderia tropica]PZW88281.1 hypothetical protein C7399_103249 [Paraburkholderia tropica]
MVVVAAKQGISCRSTGLLEDYRLVFSAREPTCHPLFQLLNGHRVAMSLVADELRVKRSEVVCILSDSKSEVHNRPAIW